MRTRSIAAHRERLPIEQPRPTTVGLSVALVLRSMALLALAVLAANLVAQRFGPTASTVDIGNFYDQKAVVGFHRPEHTATGMSYRWSRRDAALILRGPMVADAATVTLRLGGLPPGAETPRTLRLNVDNRSWLSQDTTTQLRSYTLLLPPDSLADGEVRLGLYSTATMTAADPRPLGVRVDSVTLSWLSRGWRLPPLLVLLAQFGIGLVWVVGAQRLRLDRTLTRAVAFALVVGLATGAVLDPGLVPIWYQRLFVASLVCATLLGGAARLLPHAMAGERDGFYQALMLITIGALAIRLAGVLYPVFFSHDLTINSRWLRSVQLGEMTIVDKPWEFGRRMTLISPSAYILLLPSVLLGERGVLLQAFYALIDGLTPLLIGLLARRLGLSARGALLAAGLMAVLPLQFTALYWGFVRQIVGQGLTMLLMLVLAGVAPRGRLAWSAVTTLIVVNLLIHPSTLLLTGGAIGLYLLAGLWPSIRDVVRGRVPLALALADRDLAYWRGWTFASLSAVVIALLVQYIEHARMMLVLLPAATPDSVRSDQITDPSARLTQLWVGLNASYTPLPLVLVVVGLGVLVWRVTGRARLLGGAWLASTVLFLVVDIVTAQQVRYGYFSAPLACMGLVALLEPVLKRPLGRVVWWAALAIVASAGLALWIAAIFGGVKPTLNGLTH